MIFSSPERSPGRAIVLPSGIGGGVSKKFNVKVFYVMGKALSSKLSCPCDRSCLARCTNVQEKHFHYPWWRRHQG